MSCDDRVGVLPIHLMGTVQRERIRHPEFIKGFRPIESVPVENFKMSIGQTRCSLRVIGQI